MEPEEEPPLPPDPESEPPRAADAESRQTPDVVDKRAEFERLSQQTPRDPDETRAFLESKIAIVRGDPHLSEEEKQRAIQELRRRLGEQDGPPTGD
jgi:hypothetical protein